MAAVFENLLRDFDLQKEFENLPRDSARVAEAMSRRLGDAKLRANFQIQVLSGLFFRNKGCYVVGKLINGFNEFPFALPVLHHKSEKLVIDAALFGEDDLLMLFSFARAYFMVDMEIPSAYVQFLRSMMPRNRATKFTTRWVWRNKARRFFTGTFFTTCATRLTNFGSPQVSKAW